MPMRLEGSGGPAASFVPPASTHAGVATAATTSAINSASTTTAIDPATGEPKPPSFPWITRLTLKLEQAAQKTSPFETTQITGETLNKLA
jgi:hypothetical protein